MQIIIIVTTLVLMTIFTAIITRTSLGRAQRSCEQDMKMASLLGIDVNKTISITFIMGAALAAVAGLHVLPALRRDRFLYRLPRRHQGVHRRRSGRHRLDPGAMLGGLVIGLIEVFWSAYFSVEYKDVAAFAMLAVVLIFLPQGLLGKPEVEKV